MVLFAKISALRSGLLTGSLRLALLVSGTVWHRNSIRYTNGSLQSGREGALASGCVSESSS